MNDIQRKIVEDNYKLVLKIVQDYLKYKNLRSFEDDIIQAGLEGLCHATFKYDATKGFKFGTYARMYIKGYIQNFLKYCGVSPMRNSMPSDFVSLNKAVQVGELEVELQELIADKKDDFAKFDNQDEFQRRIDEIKEFCTDEEYEFIFKFVNHIDIKDRKDYRTKWARADRIMKKIKKSNKVKRHFEMNSFEKYKSYRKITGKYFHLKKKEVEKEIRK